MTEWMNRKSTFEVKMMDGRKKEERRKKNALKIGI
jgi:hypothetical protein